MEPLAEGIWGRWTRSSWSERRGATSGHSRRSRPHYDRLYRLAHGIIRTEQGDEGTADEAADEGNYRPEHRKHRAEQTQRYHDTVDSGLGGGDEKRSRCAGARSVPAERSRNGNDAARAERQRHAEKGGLYHLTDPPSTEVPLDDLRLPPEIRRAVVVYRGELTPDYRHLDRHLKG